MYSAFDGHFPSFEETFHASKNYVVEVAVPPNSNGNHGKKRKTINDEQQTCVENQPVNTNKTKYRHDDASKRDVNIERHPIRILTRKYLLTRTGYKFIEIGITVATNSYVTIIIGDSYGKEIPLSLEMWNEFINRKQSILSNLRTEEETRTRTPMRIENLSLTFGAINNLPVLRLGTQTTRIIISLSTVLVIFNLEHCISRIAASLKSIIENVDQKMKRFFEIASTIAEPANISRAIRESDSYDRNDIIDCELVALCFGSPAPS